MRKRKRLTVSLSEEDLKKLDELREKLGCSRSDVVRYLIRRAHIFLNE